MKAISEINTRIRIWLQNPKSNFGLEFLLMAIRGGGGGGG